MVMMFSRLSEMSDNKLTDLERDKHRLELKVEKLDFQVKDLLPFVTKRKNLPTIFFITPTTQRPAQKADLTRLYWIVVEDSVARSTFISEILQRSKLASVHLAAPTPSDKKMKEEDPNWKLPRGVEQRNVALQWIRTNFAASNRGVVYFGDDDNVYDWKLFEEIRTVKTIGVWPVGIVGGLLAETPLLFDNMTVRGFNSVWKPDRPFPIDMASFAVNITRVLSYPNALFSYDSPRGFQESHLLESLQLKFTDLEPKAFKCSKVFVWHTRTEKTKLTVSHKQKFWTKKGDFLDAEIDAFN
uniref:Galactosylgalactosylxylosylprotein 3-beta-glucuronosyltransferase n=1 Tax=Ditylenchus dipsaci TaxID=166011 RepID=A0A915EQ36_9BILA